jgi:hypothetical protein
MPKGGVVTGTRRFASEILFQYKTQFLRGSSDVGLVRLRKKFQFDVVVMLTS